MHRGGALTDDASREAALRRESIEEDRQLLAPSSPLSGNGSALCTASACTLAKASRCSSSKSPRRFFIASVDGAPLAKVGYPHSVRWSPAPKWHAIVARMVHRAGEGGKLRIKEED